MPLNNFIGPHITKVSQKGPSCLVGGSAKHNQGFLDTLPAIGNHHWPKNWVRPISYIVFMTRQPSYLWFCSRIVLAFDWFSSGWDDVIAVDFTRPAHSVQRTGADLQKWAKQQETKVDLSVLFKPRQLPMSPENAAELQEVKRDFYF